MAVPAGLKQGAAGASVIGAAPVSVGKTKLAAVRRFTPLCGRPNFFVGDATLKVAFITDLSESKSSV